METFNDQIRLIRALFVETRSDANKAWLEFLSLLREVTHAEGASLVLDDQGKMRSWCRGEMCGLDHVALQAFRFDRVYSQDSLTPVTAGTPPIRIVRVRLSDGSSLALSISRQAYGRDFRSADGQMLSGIVPFLGQAMGLWLDHQQERSDSDMGAAMLSTLGGGWIAFDTTGRVLRFSQPLHGWRHKAGLTVTEGQLLRFSEPHLAVNFQQAFGAVVDGQAPVVMSIGEGEILLSRIKIETSPAILGRLRLTPQCGSLSPHVVAHNFGITVSEARLAILICDGHSLKTAAAKLGWTEESARTCSKSLFARLGVSGQPNLVRRILNSSIWFTLP